MTDHADLIARLRAGASTSWDVGEHLRKYQELCDEAADALSRPVTEEMVERGARVLADAIGEPVYTSETADVVRHILTAALGEPAAGHETYPGHDPAAGLPQPDTAGGAVSLAECPVGLFVPVARPEALCLKTEYRSNGGRIDAYIVSSGEFFWGDHPQTIANQRRQMVIPFDIATREAAIRAEATAMERERIASMLARRADTPAVVIAAIRGGSRD